MASFWQVQGQAGKALDATIRDFHTVGSDGRVSWVNLGIGTFQWSVEMKDFLGTGVPLPEYNQEVTLRRNGVRFFWGTVTSVRQRGYTVTVVVSDPWWHAEAIPLSTLQTSNPGNTKARASYVFPVQTLSASIAGLVTRSIALGVPWQLGTVATTFTPPQVTLPQMTVGSAIAELVRLCPDMQAWVDHTTTPPTINFTRRLAGLAVGSANSITLDANNLTDFEAEPMMQMKVDQVILPYVTRATDGSRIFAEQTAGTTGRVQMLTVSGPELDTFLPNDKFDSIQVQTTSISNLSTLLAFALGADSFMSSLAATYGPSWYGAGIPAGGFVGLSIASSPVTWATGTSGSPAVQSKTPNQPSQRATVGDPLSAGTWVIVRTADRLPDWISDHSVTVREGKVTLDFLLTRIWPLSATDNMIDGVEDYFEKCYFERKGYLRADGGAFQSIGLYQAEIACSFINVSYPTLTTLYRAADYTFINPPAGFAAGLLAAQNFIPYEGFAEWSDQEAGGQRYSGRLINFSNALPALASMGALVARETLSLNSGTTNLDLGAPPRLSIANATDKIRRTSQDNIVYL